MANTSLGVNYVYNDFRKFWTQIDRIISGILRFEVKDDNVAEFMEWMSNNHTKDLNRYKSITIKKINVKLNKDVNYEYNNLQI